jgi:hypothetical protein
MDLDREQPANRLPRTADTARALPRPACVVGDTLCEVQVLSEAEWEALPSEQRPSPAEYFPGLGWVVAVPGRKCGPSPWAL